MNEIGSYDHIVKVVGPATTDKGANIVDINKILEPLSSEQRQMRNLLMHTGTKVSDLALYFLENNPSGAQKNDEFLKKAVSTRFNLHIFDQLIPELDGKKDLSAGERLRSEATRIAIQIAGKFRDAIPGDVEAQFFTGSWEPGLDQGPRIDEMINDKQLRDYLKNSTRGKKELSTFRRPVDIATEMAHHTDFHLPSALLLEDKAFVAAAQDAMLFRETISQLPDQVSVPDIVQLCKDMTEFGLEEVQKTNGGKLIQLIADLVSYRAYNLRVAGVPDSVSAQILPDWRHQVAIAGVRPDIVGLYAQEDDEKALEILHKFIQNSKGKTFGRRPLLNIANQTDEQQKNTVEFYDMVRENRIHIIMGEVKCLLTGNRVVDGELTPTKVNWGLLRKFNKELGYTLWGMFQQSLGAYAREPDGGDPDVRDFTQRVNDLAHTPNAVASRVGQIRSMVSHPFIEPFFHEKNVATLAVVQWPLFREELNPKTQKVELKRALTIQQYQDVGENEIGPHTSIKYAKLAKVETKKFSDLWREIFLAGRTVLKKNSLIERIRRQAEEDKKIKTLRIPILPVLEGIGEADNFPEPPVPVPADTSSVFVAQSNAPKHDNT